MCPHVNVELVLANEAFAAAGARVRFVSCVVALVHLQLRQAAVCPAALGTLVAWSLVHVLPAVQTQAAGGAEAFAALQALEGFLPCVDEDVQLKAGRGGETVSTDGAQVRPLAGVDTDVSLQLVLVQKGFPAEGTGLWLFSLMRYHVFGQLYQGGVSKVATRA